MVSEADLAQTEAGLVPASVACPDEETQDGGVAYGRFPPSQPRRYRDGLLPD